MLLGCEIHDGDWLIIFPGTHSKHVTVKNKVVVDFKTYMTGEVFDLLSNQSILSKSVQRNSNEHKAQFEKGVKEGAAGNLLNTAFHVRTNQLFNKNQPGENYHYLSGLVIGNELKDIRSGNEKIILAANQKFGELYSSAIEIITGKKPELQDADELLIKGHCRIATRYFSG
jgi:2-dehydro-3-deoxygalactonokinase